MIIYDLIQRASTDDIINFGNEADPVFQANLDNQLGKIYIVPNTEDYDVNEKYGAESSVKSPNIGKHFPGHMGDITKAFEYTGRPYKLYASYDYYDDLYNLHYNLNVLSKLKTPSINNIVNIKHFPSITNYENKITLSSKETKYKNTKSSFNTNTTSNQNLTTMNSLGKKSKFQTNSNNNFYLTSMSVYHTDNFYHNYNPEKVYKEIFECRL